MDHLCIGVVESYCVWALARLCKTYTIVGSVPFAGLLSRRGFFASYKLWAAVSNNMGSFASPLVSAMLAGSRVAVDVCDRSRFLPGVDVASGEAGCANISDLGHTKKIKRLQILNNFHASQRTVFNAHASSHLSLPNKSLEYS